MTPTTNAADTARNQGLGKVADQRRDAIHKLTTDLASTYGKAKLALSERQRTCTSCGPVLDRDVNAAVNLARLAAGGADSNGRGVNRQTPSGAQVAVKLGAPPACGGQPGTRHRGRAGTLPPQGESAA
jgi:hypothetical protein